ncbi:Cysteine sulfinate desulfinase/cysteine desulfurase [Roseateles sp. YR242]|uniref:aminotransferase class V-fold PLP-dependent enzyme n=1 Tax=Roseateles sp. YR242 TaxID=1855305 RepID=UPI0008CC1D59|nr:aminotransferase class V-fold PLP-dependent enzyme [Roseateles sp. YR242]SEL76870.1 Cysteine sulfinate desulfinase/cysteine desulfurase [Roseateles sp. YR242]
MEIYLDANATTPVLAQARAAALAVMDQDFGNPSSIHSTGLKARALMDAVRARARRVLGVETGQLLFLSGATEGIQTAVLSALSALRAAGADALALPGALAEATGTALQPANPSPLETRPPVRWLLYGATEHKAVPEALRHWNQLLGLGLEVKAIPVGSDGRHDLAWLRQYAPQAGLVCTMAANNETGVISDLDGIAAVLAACPQRPFWLVDGVQALGKLPLRLEAWGVDYAPFSGHKLYAPKGIGLLYVRAGAPFTPLMAGGGQESALRSGTENMSGIAALGAVLAALEEGGSFRDLATLQAFRDRLTAALRDAFPELRFNAPQATTLPTTLNFSVPGLSSKLLLDLFDAADIRISGGSACSAAKAQPSHVLEAMGLPAAQTESAVRLSFGPAVDETFIREACARIRACGEALRDHCLSPDGNHPQPADGITRFMVDGACCWLIADAASRRCVVIDPLPELTDRLAQWVRCQDYQLVAVLDTHSHGDHASSAAALRDAVGHLAPAGPIDPLGWPAGQEALTLGERRLRRLATPGHTEDSTAYLLSTHGETSVAFVGDTVMPGALGRSDFSQSAPLAFRDSLRHLAETVGPHLVLAPAHDYDQRFATTFSAEAARQPLLAHALRGTLDATAFAAAKAGLERHFPLTEFKTMACGARVEPPDAALAGAAIEVDLDALRDLLQQSPKARLIDVREPYEQRLSLMPDLPELGPGHHLHATPLSRLVDALPEWLQLPADVPLIFFCRSGNRSAQAALALRRLGHEAAYTLAGGLALWPRDQALRAEALDSALYM